MGTAAEETDDSNIEKTCEVCGEQPAEAVLWLGNPWLESIEYGYGSLTCVLLCGRCLQMRAEVLLKKSYAAIDWEWPFDFASRFKKPPERGRVTARTRWLVLKASGYKCRICGATGDQEPLVVDHVIPIAEGGTSDIKNLQVLCRRCNQGKHAEDPRTGESNG